MSLIISDWDGTASDHKEILQIANGIITGRSYQEAEDLYNEAGELTLPVYFNPVTTKENDAQKIVMWKAEMINRLKADKFYEDMPDEAVKLRLLCPGCKILLVHKGVVKT